MHRWRRGHVHAPRWFAFFGMMGAGLDYLRRGQPPTGPPPGDPERVYDQDGEIDLVQGGVRTVLPV